MGHSLVTCVLSFLWLFASLTTHKTSLFAVIGFSILSTAQIVPRFCFGGNGVFFLFICALLPLCVFDVLPRDVLLDLLLLWAEAALDDDAAVVELEFLLILGLDRSSFLSFFFFFFSFSLLLALLFFSFSFLLFSLWSSELEEDDDDDDRSVLLLSLSVDVLL